MRFTPTSTYLTIANAAGKVLTWNVYVRITTSLSASNTGTTNWYNVTDKIISMPDIPCLIEYDYGQFTSNSIKLDAKDIEWWKDNIFDVATASTQYIECKLHMTLGNGTTNASDLVIPFSGYIDKHVTCKELSDTISMNVDTVQQICDRITAENIVTRYIDPDIGSGVSGLVINGISNFVVVDAAISGYQLSPGTHTLTISNSTISLDGGSAVAIATSCTAGNGNSPTFDTQRVAIQSGFYSEQTEAGNFTEDLIVLNQGETLPYQWHRNISAKPILLNLFNLFGISTANINFDNMQMNTCDGLKKVSFLDQPPCDVSISGYRVALGSDGTYLYVGVGNKLYKREISQVANPYTLIGTLEAGTVIQKIMYNARNNHLWIFYASFSRTYQHSSCGSGPFYLRRYDCGTSTLSSTITLSSATNQTINPFSLDIYDYNYVGSTYQYGILFTDSSVTDKGWLKFIDGSTMTAQSISSGLQLQGAGLGTNNIQAIFLHNLTGGKIRFISKTDPVVVSKFIEMSLSSNGRWVNPTNPINAAGNYSRVSYNSNEKRIYYWDDQQLLSHTTDDSGDITTLLQDCNVDTLYAAADNITYFSSADASDHKLQAVKNNSITSIASTSTNNGVYTIGSSMTVCDSILYGIDYRGVLFQYNSILNFYVSLADFGDMSLFGALNSILQAFNLICILSPEKKAYIYRRANDSGTPQTTTASALSLTIGNASDIAEDVSSYAKCDLITVSNDATSYSYNGSFFNTSILSDKRSFELSNNFIPDAIVKDLCYYIYQFFKTDRTLYTVPLSTIPYFQYEPIDNCSLSFTTTNIKKVGSGPIYKIVYRKNGIMEVQTLI